MSRHVRDISRRLSLRAPQKRAVEILHAFMAESRLRRDTPIEESLKAAQAIAAGLPRAPSICSHCSTSRRSVPVQFFLACNGTSLRPLISPLSSAISIAAYAVVVFVAIAFLLEMLTAVAFLIGAFLSLAAGLAGMKAATLANVRTAEAAQSQGRGDALMVAFDGGAVMGLAVAGLGIIGMSGLFLYFQGDTHLAHRRAGG